MPRIGAEPKERSCLVCGGTTTVAHMGLDICRACTVFYRRSIGRVFMCRAISNGCPITTEGVNCRKCRFDSIDRIVKESRALSQAKYSESEESHDTGASCSREFEAGNPQSGTLRPIPAQRPILARLRTSYKTMCGIRFISELNLRSDPPHPIRMKEREHQFYPATFASMNSASRVFLSAVIPFASSAFPEFENFNDEEQWTIVMNFMFRFRTFESTYRADKAFPERLDWTLGGYTTYMCAENASNYYSDCPNPNLKLEDAKRLMQKMSKTVWVNNRKLMARLQPDHEEFLAIVGIMFWTIEGESVSEEAIQFAKRYRSDILQELHIYYRDESCMKDYAARLGELLTLKSDAMKEFFELLRLLNVFDDDNFSYRLIKD